MGIRKFSTNVVSLTLSQLIIRASIFFWSVYLANKLGDSEYGKYATIIAYTGIFSGFLDFGLGVIVIREIASNKNEYQKYIGALTILRMILGSITFFSMILVAYFLSYSQEIIYLIFLYGIGMFINNWAGVGLINYQGFEDMRFKGFCNTLERLLIIFVAFAFLSVGLGLKGVFIAKVIVAVFIFFFIWYFSLRRFEKPLFVFDISLFKYLIKQATPIGLSAIFFLIYYRIDKIMLSKMVGMKEVGWYNVAFVLTSGIIELFWTPFSITIFPVLSRLWVKDRKSLLWLVRKSFLVYCSIGLSIAIGITFLADRIINLLFSETYFNSGLILSILIWTVPFTILSSGLLGKLLIVSKKQVINTQIQIGGAILNIILNLILIRILGYIGAAFATLITHVIVFIIYSVTIFRLIGQFINTVDIIKVIFLLSCMGVLFNYTKEWNLFISIMLGLSIYIIFIILLRIFKMSDIKYFRKIF